MALAGAATGGGSGDLGPLAWSNITGYETGSTNTLTISGITGSVSLAATNSGPCPLYYCLNGTYANYTGPFGVTAGDTLSWMVSNATLGTKAGTIAVTSGGSAVDSFTYVVGGPSFEGGGFE